MATAVVVADVTISVVADAIAVGLVAILAAPVGFAVATVARTVIHVRCSRFLVTMVRRRKVVGLMWLRMLLLLW